MSELPTDPIAQAYSVADDFNVVGGGASVPTGSASVADDFNVESTAGEAPSAPTDLVVTVANGGATLFWAHDGEVLSGFSIVATSGDLTRTYTVASPVARSWGIIGLTNDLPWSVTLYAVGPGGSTGASAVVITPLGTLELPVGVGPDPAVPTAPVLVDVVDGPASLWVSWTPPSDDGGQPVSSYTVTAVSTTVPDDQLSAYTFVQSVAGTRYGVVLTRLVNDLDYDVTVQAVNIAGFSPVSNTLVGSPVDGLDELLPSPVTSLDAEARSRGADLEWTLPADLGYGGFLAYDITASAAGVDTRYMLSAYDDGCQLAGLSNGVEYTVSVVVRTTVGDSTAATDTVTPSSSAALLNTFALLPIVDDAPPDVAVPKPPRAKAVQPITEAFPQQRCFHPKNFGKTVAEVPEGE